jgi:hypothetical protein
VVGAATRGIGLIGMPVLGDGFAHDLRFGPAGPRRDAADQRFGFRIGAKAERHELS